ncbi:hypothetical protein FOQG_18449 [Fusarium oxysporum f. sp. raphani 54005]|uniref:Uncharacterized protein n=2 Tax=Fusarium oxysporum TaxID=5507 RepID=X0B3W3_FUSOX|nr:hypothetical protein FOQG_18449 [Fusarium oxysporum f. sp. raphani 54005]EXL63748.1 hypothetical protein FOPG_19979 [Fusarium oxysporum f. sp. conglutinans race 2 54008]
MSRITLFAAGYMRRYLCPMCGVPTISSLVLSLPRSKTKAGWSTLFGTHPLSKTTLTGVTEHGSPKLCPR